MRSKVIAATLLLLVAIVGFSSTRDTPVREALLPKLSPAEAALERVLPEVWFDDLPLDEALERLRAAAQVELVADWEQIESTPPPGIGGPSLDRKSRVRLHVRGIRLSDALSALLAQTDGVGFAPDGGMVRISTRGALTKNVYTRCYPVRDLVRRDHGPPAPTVRIGGVISGIDVPAWADEAQRARDMVSLIENVVAPQSWVTRGGPAAKVRYFAGHLVVVQTWERPPANRGTSPRRAAGGGGVGPAGAAGAAPMERGAGAVAARRPRRGRAGPAHRPSRGAAASRHTPGRGGRARPPRPRQRPARPRRPRRRRLRHEPHPRCPPVRRDAAPARSSATP